MLVVLTTLTLAPRALAEQGHPPSAVSPAQWAGAFLTGFGSATTFTAIILTPWENLDPPDWRGGLTWGVGTTTLVAGAIIWAIANYRARGRRSSREERAEFERAPPRQPLSSLIHAGITPEVQASFDSCTEPLAGQMGAVTLGLVVDTTGAITISYSQPVISQRILSCINAAFYSVVLQPSPLERSTRFRLTIPSNAQEPAPVAPEDEEEEIEPSQPDSDEDSADERT